MSERPERRFPKQSLLPATAQFSPCVERSVMFRRFRGFRGSLLLLLFSLEQVLRSLRSHQDDAA